MIYKCIIVDDEELALDIIKKYINLIDNLDLIVTCKNAIEAFNVMQKEKIDLIFLDINMPVLSGMDFLKNLSNPPSVIFTTAYREYAVESYNLEAIDYLLKPISFERFMQAINRFLSMKKESFVNLNTNLSSSMIEEENGNFIFVKSDKKMVKIILNEILWIESMRNYVIIVTKDKKTIVYKSLKSIEEKLPSNGFIRINRSIILAVKHIEEFNMVQIKIQNNWFKIGGYYKSEVLKFLNNLAD